MLRPLALPSGRLEPETCYRAVAAGDARFDWCFCVGVKSTGVYCFPSCTAKIPARAECIFFEDDNLARRAGFRPCRRCRPQASSGVSRQMHSSRLLHEALQLIDDGELEEAPIADLANRLSISERHLRRLFKEELGICPLQLLTAKRLRFARKLLEETQWSMVNVALDAGFASQQHFNRAFRHMYNMTPGNFRRHSSPCSSKAEPGLTFSLTYASPYDWDALNRHLLQEAIPGVESGDSNRYCRSFCLKGLHGTIEILAPGTGHNLTVIVRYPDILELPVIIEHTRRLLDLDANARVISDHLTTLHGMRVLARIFPGIRIPGAWDPFELAVQSLIRELAPRELGKSLIGRLVERYGEPIKPWAACSGIEYVFPRPAALATADLMSLGLSKCVAGRISAMARSVAAGIFSFTKPMNPSEKIAALMRTAGIAEATANYIAMRALYEPDAFPIGDQRLAINKPNVTLTISQFNALAEGWRPWRSYGMMLLWNAGIGIFPESRA